MRKGERPKECEYCWLVEDSGHFSDRVSKSSDPWAAPLLQEIAKLDPKKSVNPSYLEVSFGNECNFRCSYCVPHVSSSIWSSYEKHGGFVGCMTLEQVREQGRVPLKSESNPYIKAFWDWFPSMVRDLKIFRITGGEPLVNPNTYRVLEYLEENPQPQLELCINSNFGIPERYFQKFLDKISSLTKSGKIKSFMVFTSVDTHGAHAEYIRVGLKYDEWLSRVQRYLEVLPWDLTFMTTFNALSPARFPLLLSDIARINRPYVTMQNGRIKKRTHLDISHLMQPEIFSAWVLTPRWIEKIEKLATLMETRFEESQLAGGFSEFEIQKMKRIAAWARNTSENPLQDPNYFRALFYIFTQQFEEREGKKFADVFPEMEDYYLSCEEALDAQGKGFVNRELSKVAPMSGISNSLNASPTI
jgi:organic radical activating enzyme